MYRNQSGNASRISTKAAILSTSPLFPVRATSRVRATGLEYTIEHPAETPGGNSPPDCCIFIGSSPLLFPVRATGLDYTMEHPAETPGGNSPLDCCIYMGSSPSPGYQQREPPRGLSFLVRATGLEPARLSQRNLNPPSLPIPPRPHVACSRVILSWEPGNVNGRQSEPLKFQAKADPCPNKFLKVSVLSGKMTVCKDSHRQEVAKAHGAERAF